MDSGVISVAIGTRFPLVASASTAYMQGAISFLHPGYNKPTNVLFRMPRVDYILSSTPASVYGGRDELWFGVYHRTVLAVCQIVANNALDRFLALDMASA